MGCERFLCAGLALAGPLAACDQWALSVGGNGLMFIGVIGDNHHFPGRFRVRALEADGATRILDLPAAGHLRLSGLTAGEVELTLLVPPGCRVAGPNPQTLLVASDQPVDVAFEVHCSP